LLTGPISGASDAICVVELIFGIVTSTSKKISFKSIYYSSPAGISITKVSSVPSKGIVVGYEIILDFNIDVFKGLELNKSNSDLRQGVEFENGIFIFNFLRMS
jgi:hypothetical protein